MFIKILTPNHNGKIELTVRDLEALIQEAVDKAITEDRANRPIQFWYGNGDVNKIDTTPNWDWTKVTCNDNNATLLSSSSNSKNNNKVVGGITLISAINDIIGEQTK
jgi:hypothetical protein